MTTPDRQVIFDEVAELVGKLKPDELEILRRRVADVMDESASVLDGVTPSAEERVEIRRLLVAAGVREDDLDWMTASCPSLVWARYLYGGGRQYTEDELQPYLRAVRSAMARGGL